MVSHKRLLKSVVFLIFLFSIKIYWTMIKRQGNQSTDVIGSKLTMMCQYNETGTVFNASKYKLSPVPKHSLKNDTTEPVSPETAEFFTTLNRTLCEDFSVLILTPIHNSERDIENYVNLIRTLNYPKNRLSVVLGEDGSNDRTFLKAQNAIEVFRSIGLRRADVLHFNFTGGLETNSWMKEHSYVNQFQRRSHLARARNLLLMSALMGDEDYVLWMDSDLRSVPPDLIQQMIYVNKDVVTASCLFRENNGRLRIYDKNSWRETAESLQRQRKLPQQQLVVEGYGASLRVYLPHLQGEGKRVVSIDGVGGCSLMIKAECHRNGLYFPEKLFQRHIETEGLAKMAKHMGYGVYGLPFLNVFHS